MNANHPEISASTRGQQITLRSAAELADALPFVLGFHPTDSVVLVALHGENGRFGGRVRIGIPRAPGEWDSTADNLAECLVETSVQRTSPPDGIVGFLCQDPGPGETAGEVYERLRPFAQRLRTACGALDIPVYEVLCISGGRHFSYCCPDERCCPPDGTPLALSGTSVMAAAAAYAGIQVRGSLREMEDRFKPTGGPGEAQQRSALDAAAARVVPLVVDGAEEQGKARLRETTLALAGRLLGRFAEPPRRIGPDGVRRGQAALDADDDARVEPAEAAAVILGLQDRITRDRLAEWMEGPEGVAAVRLWRVLARRCVAPYQEYAAAPLTLAGWAAWSTGDEPTARVALNLALDADPAYVFARLLHQACNEGLEPEALRSCLRGERENRMAAEKTAAAHARRTRTRTRTRTRGARPGGPRPALPKAGTGVARRGRATPGSRPAGRASTRPGGPAPRHGGRRGSRSGR
ncbi:MULTISPECIES: DUF4192 domain-containing protein [Streptomyces]|uniref:DUF4192 domain-containing protein n=2 Tax=Streptomyces TaxID=1883 RepID=A0ABU4K3H3_9ACTN|nr:DUF4192 domain-containing protein [Streptomyces roseolus]MDX2292290.1 DUF4192 domain-containing protein [Streptomyces roseolus]